MTHTLAEPLIRVNDPPSRFLRERWLVGKPRHSVAGQRLAQLLVELDREHEGYGSQRRVSEITGIDTAQVTTILADPDAPRDVSGRTIEGVIKRMGIRAEYFFGPTAPATYRDFLGRASDSSGARGEAPMAAIGPLVVLEIAKDEAAAKTPLTPMEIERLVGMALAMPHVDKAHLRDSLESILAGDRARAKTRPAARPARRK